MAVRARTGGRETVETPEFIQQLKKCLLEGSRTAPPRPRPQVAYWFHSGDLIAEKPFENTDMNSFRSYLNELRFSYREIADWRRDRPVNGNRVSSFKDATVFEVKVPGGLKLPTAVRRGRSGVVVAQGVPQYEGGIKLPGKLLQIVAAGVEVMNPVDGFVRVTRDLEISAAALNELRNGMIAWVTDPKSLEKWHTEDNARQTQIDALLWHAHDYGLVGMPMREVTPHIPSFSLGRH